MPTIELDIDTSKAQQKIDTLVESLNNVNLSVDSVTGVVGSGVVPMGITSGTITATNGTVIKNGTVMVSPLPDIKAGRRNNTKDQERIQNVHDHSVELGAMCGDSKKSVEIKAQDVQLLNIPLDVLVSSVQNAFWDLRTEARLAQKPYGVPADGYWEWDSSLVPYCVAVYFDYAIARVGLAHFKVPFTVQNMGVELGKESEWEQVEQEWVVKNIPVEALRLAEIREVNIVKSIKDGRLGNYLVAWGNEKERDLYGEYFTKNTEGLTAMFDHLGKLPALYQHAMDGTVKYTPIGTIDKMEVDDVGVWIETQLDLANKYAQAVQQLARKRALGSSSGTLPGARKVAANGEIKQWVIIEGSFTPTPAEYRLRELGVEEVKSIYAEYGLELPDDINVAKDGQGAEEVRHDDDTAIEVERERLRLLELELSLITTMENNNGQADGATPEGAV